MQDPAVTIWENIPRADKDAAHDEKCAARDRVLAFLASSQAAGITGQLFGVRGREVFVWSASRPAASCFQPRAFDADEFAQAFGGLRRDFTDLGDDTTAFGDDPVA